jgi:hypothetical protein
VSNLVSHIKEKKNILRASKKRVLRRISGPMVDEMVRGWIKLHD